METHALLQEGDRNWAARIEGRGRFCTLDVSGGLHAGWAGRLAAALARRRVSVVRGQARQSAALVWTGRFELEVLDPALDPSSLDVVAMMREPGPPSGPPADLELASYAVRSSLRCVEVALRTTDSVGLLDRLLRGFAFFGLFPCELRLETYGAEVDDAFLLRSLDHRAPRPNVVSALDRRLGSMVRRAS